MFTHAMDFFNEHVSLKKLGPKHLFKTKQFIDKGFDNIWQFAFNKIHKAPKTNVCNSKMANMGVT